MCALTSKGEAFLQDGSKNLTTFKIAQHIKFADSVNMMLTSWEQVECSVIVNAWVKSTIAAYWGIPKMGDQKKLNRRQAEVNMKQAKSIFKDLDVF